MTEESQRAKRLAESLDDRSHWERIEQLQRRVVELQKARAEAEASSAAKTEFLTSMSHELRTPLNAILGFAQLLQRDHKRPLEERHQSRVEQIVRGGEHLLHLVDDILDLSRIERGAVSISPRAVDVRVVLDDVVSSLEALAADHAGSFVELDDVPTSGPIVEVDRTRFTQILTNFGSNAIKYGRPGGHVRLGVRADEVLGHAIVTVQDDGPGIPTDKQPMLFEPFYRAGQETSAIPGTGIGLAIARRLAELMKGSVGCSSEVGRGSTFWVQVPLSECKASPSPTSRRTPPPLRPPRVDTARALLYVEDNPANASFMEDFASLYDDLEFVWATTGERGIELAAERRPTVIVMDIDLPGMSGIDTAIRLREAPATREIPVVALTAGASDDDRRRAAPAHFYRYLTKPVDVDELRAALDPFFA